MWKVLIVAVAVLASADATPGKKCSSSKTCSCDDRGTPLCRKPNPSSGFICTCKPSFSLMSFAHGPVEDMQPQPAERAPPPPLSDLATPASRVARVTSAGTRNDDRTVGRTDRKPQQPKPASHQPTKSATVPNRRPITTFNAIQNRQASRSTLPPLSTDRAPNRPAFSKAAGQTGHKPDAHASNGGYQDRTNQEPDRVQSLSQRPTWLTTSASRVRQATVHESKDTIGRHIQLSQRTQQTSHQPPRLTTLATRSRVVLVEASNHSNVGGKHSQPKLTERASHGPTQSAPVAGRAAIVSKDQAATIRNRSHRQV